MASAARVRGILDSVLSRSALLSVSDAALLLRAAGSTSAIAAAADAVRARDAGDAVTYVVNRNINFTNVCVKRCGFCAFSRTAPEGEGYFLPVDEVVRRARQAAEHGATEVCVQAGLPPLMHPLHYERLAGALKAALPALHLHAFSPEEVKYGAALNRVSLREFVRRLQAAGVDSLPGTSAEILDDALRARIAKGRISSAEWREVVTEAHGAGLRTTSTMMYGFGETPEQVAAHLGVIRDIQLQTGGFTEFVPLSFVASEAPMVNKGAAAKEGLREGPLGGEVLRVHAVARLFLSPHIPNIQVSWVKEGLRMAAALLGAGVNDLGGVLINESISTSAGAAHGQFVRPSTLRRVIRDVGRAPRQRSTLYGTLREFAAEEAPGEAAGEPLEAFSEAQPEAVAHAFGSYRALAAAAAAGGEHSFRGQARKGGSGSGSPAGACSGGSSGGARAFSTRAFSARAAAQGPAQGAAAPQPQQPPPPLPEHTVTVSSCFTLVPTFECFNACSYCTFRASGAASNEEAWLALPAAHAILARVRALTWGAPPWAPRLLAAGFAPSLLPPTGTAQPGGGPLPPLPHLPPSHAHLHADLAARPPPPPGAPAPAPTAECLILSGEVSRAQPARRAAWLARVAALSRAAAAAGLLPHLTVGPLTAPEMAALWAGSGAVSMGLMMEQLTARPLAVHARAPSKWSAPERAAQLRQAGALRIPFTTGMLLGIGESAEDRARTASECGEAAAAHGHVGEFIVQPLVGGATPFDARELPEAVFQARRRLPEGVVVQIPPNLAVQRRSGSDGGGEWDYSILLQCLEAGARDLGGVSPRDEVNAGHAFPALAEVEAALGARGWALRSRLPLHPAQYALLEGGGSSSGEAWGAMQPWLALRALPGGTHALLA